jgi:methionine-gamma-lyase
MAIHPATTTHLKIPKDLRNEIGIYDNLIRISIGIEETADLINDLNFAFGKLKNS